MKIVTKSFLRYLPRRLSLSLLQLMGVACGVAAVVGMTMSALTALGSFTKAVEFLSGKATHSMQRPAGPMEESALAGLARDPAVERFSPVLDRRLRLGNGDLVRFLGVDPFLDRAYTARDRRCRGADPTDVTRRALFPFFWTTMQSLSTRSSPGSSAFLRVACCRPRGVRSASSGRSPTPPGEPLVLMDIAHAQKLFTLNGFVDRVDLILTDERRLSRSVGKGLSHPVRTPTKRDILRHARCLPAQSRGAFPAGPLCRCLSDL